MADKQKLSAGSFFSAYFAASAVSAVSLTPRILCGGLKQNLAAVGISFVVVALLALPTLWLDRMGLSVAEAACLHGGKRFSLALRGLYVAVVTYSAYHFLTFFLLFVENTLAPALPVWVVSLCICGAALYGAWRGPAAVGRSGVFVAAGTVLGFLLLFLLLSRHWDTARVQAYSSVVWEPEAVIWMTARRSSVLPELVLLLPQIKGKKTAGFFAAHTAGHLLSVGVFCFLAGSLGVFAARTVFPVFTLASLAEVGAWRRLDVILPAVWTVSIILRLSLCFLAAGSGVFPKSSCRTDRKMRVCILLQAAVVCLCAAYTVRVFPDPQALAAARGLVWPVPIVCGGVPLALYLAEEITRRKEKRRAVL